MNALIIGAGGFVGGYLIDELCGAGFGVTATRLSGETIRSSARFDEEILDILDEAAVADCLIKHPTDVIFHLAAQSSVAMSWEKPALTADINIRGCINLLQAARKAAPRARIMLIGSGEEYGFSASPEINEQAVPQPANIYALTKYTQNLLGQIYCRAYGMDIVSVRAFNHIGAGQQPTFAAADFCRQAAEIEAGRAEPVIAVGNLAAKRDFTDVRDIVRAYRELALHGKSGETYNVASGRAVELREILDIILSLVTAEITVCVDSARLRPVDIPEISADITKLRRDTGWSPQIPLQDTIRDMLDYFRAGTA